MELVRSVSSEDNMVIAVPMYGLLHGAVEQVAIYNIAHLPLDRDRSGIRVANANQPRGARQE